MKPSLVPDARSRTSSVVVTVGGRRVKVARPRGHLFVCGTGCCCGRTENGHPAVPTELYHGEWERRRLRNRVHLTVAGCLGPCALANVVLLVFDGRALWLHSMNSEALVLALYDHVERMLVAGRRLPTPEPLARLAFAGWVWNREPTR